MKLIILGDLHLISRSDPFKENHASRGFFTDAWPSFKQLSKLIKQEAPDLIISLGDLVDWYSDENRDMALEFMDELQLPWLVTPGNHDYEKLEWREKEGKRKAVLLTAREGYASSKSGWEKRGIEHHNRFIEADGFGLLLMNSAFSDVPPGTKEWLSESLERCRRNLLFTHVPLNVPETRDYILSVEPHRDLKKYVQSGAPWVYPEGLAGRVQHVFTGHLHFPGEIRVDQTGMHMLGMGITRADNLPAPPASCCSWRSDRPDQIAYIGL